MRLGWRLRNRVSELVGRPASPESLAVLRIVTFVNVLLYFPRASALEGFADLPTGFRRPPVGLGTVAPRLPITRPLIRGASRVTLAAAALGTVGLWTAPASVAVIAAGLYVGSIQWYFTRVGHQHHMLWFAALVAVSPSSDVLSVDAYLRRRRRGPVHHLPSPAYGAPLRLGWLLLASIYFLPGVAKLATGGPRWVFSDNLRNRAWLEWHGRARKPGPALRRMVKSRLLMRSAALITVVFEIGFVLALPSRRGRRALTGLSFLFHGGIWLVLELDFFMSLAYAHLGLHEWPAARRPAGVPAIRRDGSKAPIVVVSGIILANHIMPLTGAHYGWPFTIYPIFHGVADRHATSLRVEIHRRGERPTELDVRGAFQARGLSPGISGFLESSAMTALLTDDQATFEGLWQMLSASAGLREGDEAAFFADTIDVDPARWTDPVVATTELARRAAHVDSIDERARDERAASSAGGPR